MAAIAKGGDFRFASMSRRKSRVFVYNRHPVSFLLSIFLLTVLFLRVVATRGENLGRTALRSPSTKAMSSKEGHRSSGNTLFFFAHYFPFLSHLLSRTIPFLPTLLSLFPRFDLKSSNLSMEKKKFVRARSNFSLNLSIR